MDEAPAHLSPALRIIATNHDDVSRQAEIAEGAMKAHRLLSLVSNLRLDDEKIDVAA
jgi:hypothetical protein